MASLAIELVSGNGAGGLGNRAGAAAAALHVLPGSVLQGQLVLHTAHEELRLNEKGIHFYFEGKASSEIRVSRQSDDSVSSTETHWGGGPLFSITAHPLQAGRAEHIFPPNQRFTFPFQFTVPPITLSTQAWQANATDSQPEDDTYCCAPGVQMYDWASASVRYSLRATAHVAGMLTSNIKVETEIIVDPIYPAEPTPGSLQPGFAESEVRIPSFLCCESFGYKTLSGSVSAPKGAVLPGEVLPVQLRVRNQSGRAVTRMTLAVQSVVKFNAPTHFGILNRFTAARTVQEVRVASSVGKEETLVGQLVVSGLVPEVSCDAFSVRNELLARLTLEGTKRALNLRMPLSAYWPQQQPPQLQQQEQQVAVHPTAVHVEIMPSLQQQQTLEQQQQPQQLPAASAPMEAAEPQNEGGQFSTAADTGADETLVA